MIAEIAHFCLIMAGVFALSVTLLPIFNRVLSLQQLTSIAFANVYAQGFLILISYLGLSWCFFNNDFSLTYIAEHSSMVLPWYYRLTAVWGAHEGSMLLWVLFLSAWMVVFAASSRHKQPQLVFPTLWILAALSVGFIAFIALTSNPFWRNFPVVPTEGADLNPLLQDPGFLIHPPMLYMGYVGYAIAYAMAMAALFRGEFSQVWAQFCRSWILAAWCFLTIGITLGSWWAYRMLGWGGWWFWDPVENAAFLPWLMGTALLHSIIVLERRGMLKAWTVLLAITAFALSLLGTFLVRSGVLTSVHAFAVDPKRGIFILGFLFLVMTSSLGLYSLKVRSLNDKHPFHKLSRESLLLLNNILFMVLMLTILIGTLYPLLIDALGFGKISVGAPYFNRVFVPLAFPLLILMGIGPHCQWRESSLSVLWERLQPLCLFSALLLLLTFILLFFGIPLGLTLGLVLAGWILLSTFRLAWRWYGRSSIRDWPTSRFALLLAHCGVAVTLCGITINSYYSEFRLVKVALQQTIDLDDYQITFLGTEDIQGSNFHGILGRFRVEKSGKLVEILTPEKRLYDRSQMPMTNAGIHIGWWGDLYIALGEPLETGEWSVRIYQKPFIRWIWGGGVLMLLGGLCAVFSRRKKVFNDSNEVVANVA